jgi:hypothetical protein
MIYSGDIMDMFNERIRRDQMAVVKKEDAKRVVVARRRRIRIVVDVHVVEAGDSEMVG